MFSTRSIVYDNLFRLIRNEYFNEKITLEPLSPYKQSQVLLLKEKFMGTKDVYNPKERYQFSNNFIEKRRVKLFDDERHAIDTSTDTLNLLNLLIYNITEMENRGISLHGIISVGLYLRNNGQNVDFVKLDKWISHLHIKRMSSLIASILVEGFGFEVEEIPFLYKVYPKVVNRLYQRLEDGQPKGILMQTNNIFRYSPVSAIGLLFTRTKQYLSTIEE